MKTKKTPVQAFKVECLCECGGICNFSGADSIGSKYEHVCEKCGQAQYTAEIYPMTVFEEIESASTALENPVTEENLKPGVVLRNRKEDYKFVVLAKTRFKDHQLDAIQQKMDDYEFVCERPHEDGDFSYLCNSSYCRCQQ